MSVRWLIHSRDRTFGPWTSIQVRDELRAGRIDPFDMACKEGSTVKRPLVEVDEIFQSSRVQMAELVEVADQVEDQKATRSTKRATSEPEPIPVEKPLANTGSSPPAAVYDDRPRPSQFQALAAAARLDPPGRAEARKPKQYFVTDSTGRSYGPLSSGEVMKLWHSGRIDSRAVVERGSGSKRISIQKFVDFYQKAAPSGIAFMTRANQPMNPRYRTATADSGSKLVMLVAGLMAIAALVFLGTTMRNRLPPQLNKYLPKSKAVPEAQRFDLKAIETIVGGGQGEDIAVTPPANTPTRVQDQQTNLGNMNIESIQIRPTKGSSKKPLKLQPQRKLGRPQPQYRYAPAGQQKSRPLQNPATATNRGAPQVAVRPPAQAQTVARPIATKPKLKSKVPARPFVDGSTMTLSGYRFSQGDLSQCDGKCKIAMTGPNGPVTAVFFKEALGDSFEGKSAVTLTGIIRKTAAGWSIIVSFAR